VKYAVIVVFVAIMIGVGVASRRRTSSVNDFFLGGRDVGPWLSAFAYGTTYFSAVLFVGYAGKVGFGFGLSSLWIVAGNAILGSLLAWWVLAGRTRTMTERLNAMTMPEFLAGRYGSRWLKIAGALVIFVFLVPYSASVYTGLAYLFEKTFGINYTWALILMAGLTAVYLVLGGYIAVARNDLIQGVVMIVGVVFMIVFVLRAPQVGGLSHGLQKLHDISPTLTSAWPGWHFDTSSVKGVLGSPGLMLIALVLLTSLGPWGLPQMVHKFYAIKDRSAIRPAIIISTLFAALMTFGAYFTGSLTHLFPQAGEFAKTGQFDNIMPTVLNQALPEVLVVIVLLLVLSASMSTLAGLVMVSASVITVDLVQGEWKRDMSKSSAVLLMRVLVILFIVVSVVLAQQKITIILTLMALSWGTVAGAFIGPFVWGLFWKRVTKWGAWAGMLSGLVVTIVPYGLYGSKYTPIFAVAAMLFSLMVTPVVSLLSPAPARELVARAFGEAPAEGRAAAEPVPEPAAD
jgi:SSS family solute:Na+ symporter